MEQNKESNAVPNNKVMSILSYLGPLVIISYLVAKNEPFVKFHIKQGLVLFVIEIVMWFIASLIWILWPLTQLVNLITVILAIVGIVNVVNKREKELPIVGKFSSYFDKI